MHAAYHRPAFQAMPESKPIGVTVIYCELVTSPPVEKTLHFPKLTAIWLHVRSADCHAILFQYVNEEA